MFSTRLSKQQVTGLGATDTYDAQETCCCSCCSAAGCVYSCDIAYSREGKICWTDDGHRTNGTGYY